MIIFFLFVFTPPYYSNPIDIERDLLVLEKHIQNHSYDSSFWKSQLKLYVDLHDLSKAEPLIDRLCSLRPEDPVYQDLKMMILVENGQLEEAVMQGEALLSRFPGYDPVTLNLSIAYFKIKQPAKALNLLFSTNSKNLRPQDWQRVVRFLDTSMPSKKYTLKLLIEKSKKFPENRRLGFLVLSYLVRTGSYNAIPDWIDRNLYLTQNPEIQEFYEGIKRFEK